MKICIVDGYSTGATLTRRLRDLGVNCIHVQSEPRTNEYLQRSFRPDDYSMDFGYTADIPALAGQLATLGISRVVAGSESGVTLAETLAQQLGLPTNTPGGRPARRDKALMYQTAQRAGLDVPQGTTAGSPAAAAAWFTASGLTEAVVKPLASAATDGVRFCQTPEEIAHATEAILAKPNIFGQRNTAVIIQERLSGDEYYINSVSSGGAHRIAEIWRYTKRASDGPMPLYDYEEPVALHTAEAKLLKSYTCRVLDALGIQESAAHTEVMLTARGPVLIETGARLGGATSPDIIDKYLGTSQTALLAATLVDPRTLLDFDDQLTSWPGRIRNVEFINPTPGRASAEAAGTVATLPSAIAVCSSITPGEPLERTSDLTSSPGYVYLAAESQSIIDRDYTLLRQWEREGLHIR
ncbi:ATP-grasp domain-containing protein [Streptomyces sp. NPDC001787]|uniref:ATP-grasp domain-containing protein n=1 Tax=Streptomyces sp. NPDC001787 TaxID=3154523 RepID=UPI00333013A0